MKRALENCLATYNSCKVGGVGAPPNGSKAKKNEKSLIFLKKPIAFFEKCGIILYVAMKRSPNFIRRDIEVVITGLTRNQFVRKHTRVRIPLSPPNKEQ